MNQIQTLFRNHGRSYREMFASRMPLRHLKTMTDIERCRTNDLGVNLYACTDCSHHHMTNPSCGNRHCPTCQGDKGHRWFDKNRAAMLPCSYFMVTFTMPEQMRHVARANQAVVYDAFCRLAYRSLAKLARDDKYLGAKIGALAVLHTWGDELQCHPHIHMIVPAGGVLNAKEWKSSRQDFLVPVKALSKIVRGKMKEALEAETFFSQIPSNVWHEGWNVHCKNVGNGHNALGYLAQYLFRVAIQPKRVVRADQRTVTFKRKKERSEKLKNVTMATTEFLRRFLQHTLPKGFTKVRRYGILAANAKVDISHLASEILGGFVAPTISPDSPKNTPGYNCKTCGARMRMVKRVVNVHEDRWLE